MNIKGFHISTVVAIFLLSFPAVSQDFKLEEKKIRFLIEEVANSEATFLRNGDEHTPTRAAEHLEYKWKRAKKPYIFFGDERFLTVEQFIVHIASHSSTTGEKYHIRPKGQKKIPTEDWLRAKLKDYRAVREVSSETD